MTTDTLSETTLLSSKTHQVLTHKVECPIGRSRECVCGSPDPQRYDLGGIQPRHTQPADGEKRVKQEEKKRGDDARAFGSQFRHYCQDYL